MIRKEDLAEVEPLSERRWSDIERRVFETLDAEGAPESVFPERGLRWGTAAWLVLAGGLAAGVGVVASRVLQEAPSSMVPSRVETARSGTHVETGEASLDVGPNSALLLSGDDTRGITIVLDRGHVECEVAPRRGRAPFLVRAGGVQVRVVGTHFAVDREGDSAHVSVSRGVVEVVADGTVARVAAGEQWPPSPPESTAPTPTPAPAPPAIAAPLPTTPSGPVPTPASDLANARALRRSPQRPSTKATDLLTAPEPESQGGPASSSSPSAPKAALAASSTAPPAPSVAVPTPSPVAPAERAAFEAAAKAEAADPATALSRYLDLAKGSGPWAANALYAAGRLQAERDADSSAARRTLQDYLARFPAGPNASDARDLLKGLP